MTWRQKFADSLPVRPTFLRQVPQRVFFFLASLSPSLSSLELHAPASALSSGSDFCNEINERKCNKYSSHTKKGIDPKKCNL